MMTTFDTTTSSTFNDLAAEMSLIMSNNLSSSNSAGSSNSPTGEDVNINSIMGNNINAINNNATNNNTNGNFAHYTDVMHWKRILQECKSRLMSKQKTCDTLNNRLLSNYHKAQQDAAQAYQMLMTAIEKNKNDLMKELDDIYNARVVSLTLFGSKIDEGVRKIDQHLSCSNDSHDMTNYKSFIDNKLQAILNIDLDSSNHSHELEFVPNYSSMQILSRSNIGYIRSGSNNETVSANGVNSMKHHLMQNSRGGAGMVNGGGNNFSMNSFDSPSNGIADRFSSMNLNGSSGAGNHRGHHQRSLASSVNSDNMYTFDKWSNVSMNGSCGLSAGSNSSPDSTMFTTWSNPIVGDGLTDLTSEQIMDLNAANGGGAGGDSLGNSQSNIMPIKSQVQRQKMIYHCKFGEFGIMEGQFTEPSGVAVNAQNDIIVADTNNHRIQIFDKDGRFKFQFGECGKRDGQLLYPNRVAVIKQSGDIIVTERSPTHQIQVYNQYGQFVRKFGADILQHPRGVTVDNKGNIIIVECKVMRVIIFDLTGNVLHKFGCSKHLEFPNGVVVNDKQEIFISDNRAHCVKVFSYSGTFLRNIGGEGLTNYPIGVCINDSGEILVADNHNNFNITIFTQDGQLVNALESKVKHSQCFDVALMDDNSVVLASKDYRIYIYRYLQLQSLATAVATSGIC